MDADGENVTRVTNNTANDFHQKWSPDGMHMVFISDRDDKCFELYIIAIENGDITRLTNNLVEDMSPGWAP
jgi:TolB protein